MFSFLFYIISLLQNYYLSLIMLIDFLAEQPLNIFYWFELEVYNIISDSKFFWYIYEKYFFFVQSRSYRYYTRILWKPSLNISDHIFNVPIFFVLQTMFLVIITVWARAVGPRMRMDQLSQFVWKDFVPSLTLILLTILIIMLF